MFEYKLRFITLRKERVPLYLISYKLQKAILYCFHAIILFCTVKYSLMKTHYPGMISINASPWMLLEVLK